MCKWCLTHSSGVISTLHTTCLVLDTKYKKKNAQIHSDLLTQKKLKRWPDNMEHLKVSCCTHRSLHNRNKAALGIVSFLIQKMAPKSPYNSLPKSLRVHMKEILMNGSPKCQSDLNKGDYCLPLIPYVMLQEPWQQMSPFLTIVVILTQTNMFKQSKLSIYF